MISICATDFAPWRIEVPMQSLPVSPPPITSTSFPRASIGGAEIGKAGVIGPERMDYDKVVSVLHYIQKVFNGDEAPDDNKEKKNGEIRTRE